MDNLPVELIRAIAHFFDGTTLVTSLQVCRRWHLILHPLIWRLIQTTTWHNSRFPLREKELEDPTKATTLLDDPKLVAALLHVQSLDWRSIHVAKDKKQKRRRQHSVLSLDTLGRIVGLTSNLVHLHLQSRYQGKKFESLPLFVGYLHGLQSLRDLALLLSVDTENPVAVDELFPVFSRLDRLAISGLWVSPERALGKEEKGVGEGHMEAQQSWRIKTLTVDTRLLSLARHCPSLVFLTAGYDFNKKPPTPETSSYSLRSLSRCQQLKCVMLPNAPNVGETIDIADCLPSFSLPKFMRLLIPVTRPEDIECLNGGCRQEGTMVMPTLHHLHILSVPSELENNRRLQLAIRKFLISRTRLTWIYLSTITIEPEFVFAQPGKELEHGWGCGDKLHWISFKLPSSTQWAARCLGSQRDLLSSVYRQLGCLTSLQVLEIECQIHLDLHMSGIRQLKGATKLNKVTLIGFEQSWNREGIKALVEAVPGLKTLELRPLSEYHRQLVLGWLKDVGRPDVELFTW
ncbi:hypothetical protein F5H01DRAFT_329224 [Linnemannia elongata]|nr:hypothetical protein F5H01DRAFT_329224 [Linnemannia elongata]